MSLLDASECFPLINYVLILTLKSYKANISFIYKFLGKCPFNTEMEITLDQLVSRLIVEAKSSSYEIYSQ